MPSGGSPTEGREEPGRRPTLRLPVRRGPLVLDGVAGEIDESDGRYVHAVWELEIGQCALVLTDVWDRHSLKSHSNRALEIVRTGILPALTAARRAGVTVVHAPAPEVLVHYPEAIAVMRRHRRRARRERAAELAAAALRLLTWPPRAFRRREGDWGFLRQPPPVAEKDRIRLIAEAARPLPGEPLVPSGRELQRELRKRRILHLFYAGFAANQCLNHTRDYSMRAMRLRGYNPILLRDCTTGIENAATVDGLIATRAAVADLEQSFASTTAAEFVAACEGLGA